MRINIIAKTLIIKGILLFPLYGEAWTVPDRIVELPLSAQSVSQVTAPNAIFKKQEPAVEIQAAKPISSLTPNADGPFFEKRKATLNQDEQGGVDYRRALEHISNGETTSAKRLLMSTLNEMPRHHASRIALGTLYIKENLLDGAEDLLAEGLRLDEDNADFLRLMAAVHNKRDEPDKALALLVKVKDSRTHDKNYMAFLGHVYQQTGRYALARQQYFRLLQMEPKNSLWLLGVSIALDAEGQKTAALDGYHRLTAEGNIDPGILKYVQDRINVLKG